MAARRFILGVFALFTLGLVVVAAQGGAAERMVACRNCAFVAEPWTAYGINLAGPAFRPEATPGVIDRDFVYPGEDALDYYRVKGFRVVRLTFLWERIQPRLFEPLDPDEVGRLERFVDAAARRGMHVVTGPHNYARYRIDGEPHLIGSLSVPIDAFADLWRRLAERFRATGDNLIFSLMNEPHSTGGGWKRTAQLGVDAIREVDARRWIYVPGDNWSSAQSWLLYNSDLILRDRSDRLVYEAHQYFDDSKTGFYERSYDDSGAYPTIGVDRIRPFLGWLKAHRLRGAVTEYGVPNDDPRWLVVLDKFMAEIRRAGVGGAYWAGGPWWGEYPLSAEPRGGQDAPVMSILVKYVRAPGRAEQR